jgi:GntR family transcriptional regulator
MHANYISNRLSHDLEEVISNTPVGGKLPSEPKLSKQMGVSRATLREAMRAFETQGRIQRKQGSGTYVTQISSKIDSGLEILESIERMANRFNLSVDMGDRKIVQRYPSDEEKKALDLGENDQVIAIDRVILIETRPVAFLIDVVPTKFISLSELEQGFTGSVLEFLLKKGIPALTTSRTEINAVTANHDIARLLGIQRGDVLLFFEALLFSIEGNVIDHSKSYFLPGYFRFHVLRRVG